MSTIIGPGNSRAPNKMYGVMATSDRLPDRYDKQETNPERLGRAKIEGEGNYVKVKYGIPRGEDEGNADMRKVVVGALAKLTSANNPRNKKVFNEKQGNDGRRNRLVNLDDKIVLKGAGGDQNRANSRKGTTNTVPERQGKEVLQAPGLTASQDSGTAAPSKGSQQIKTVAGGPLAKAHKHGSTGTQRKAAMTGEVEEQGQGGEEQGPPGSRASESLQQQGRPGAKSSRAKSRSYTPMPQGAWGGR